jgi:arylformamidase
MKTSGAFLICALSLPAAAAETNQPAGLALPPTFANVSYGSHQRNVLDFWQAKSGSPTPLLLYIHGGGWYQGNKADFPTRTVKAMLEHGISVASINYRYSTNASLPAPVYDAARALQFIRSKAAEWNLDKQRVAAMGGSAGACTSLWLVYHDDLAKPQSADPVARESTRLCAAVGIVGQTSIDPEVIVPWVGQEIANHLMISRAVGATNYSEIKARYPEYRAVYREFSPINHVSSDDPPVFLYYATPSPLPAPNPSLAIHHAMLGQKLKEKADAAGLVCELHYSDAGKPDQNAPLITEFLLRYLSKP